MLNLDLLVVFISVAKNQSFTRAGADLNRSQSAISMHVKRLEEILGASVFERSGKHVTLSPEGKVLLGYARRILDLANEAMTEVGKKHQAKRVRLGCIEDYAARVLPRMLAEFWHSHPNVHIEVDTGESGDLTRKLGDEYDVVLSMAASPPADGMLVRTERLIWATSFAQSPHFIDPLPVALRPEGSLESEWATSALDASMRPWRCAFVSAGLGPLQRAVEEGLAVGIFKESVLTGRMRPLTVADGFPELPNVCICLHAAPGSAEKPEVRLLVDALLQKLKPEFAAMAAIAQ